MSYDIKAHNYDLPKHVFLCSRNGFQYIFNKTVKNKHENFCFTASLAKQATYIKCLSDFIAD